MLKNLIIKDGLTQAELGVAEACCESIRLMVSRACRTEFKVSRDKPEESERITLRAYIDEDQRSSHTHFVLGGVFYNYMGDRKKGTPVNIVDGMQYGLPDGVSEIKKLEFPSLLDFARTVKALGGEVDL